ncbi:MAG: AzlD domain-containing protein [Actinomycetota bacterium]|nr:AzlD domain-containing protein [Actinomycetota bacterium]
MTALLVFVVAGLGTYAARAVFIVGVGERPLPARVERALPYLGPAVLAALVSSLLTAERGAGGFLRDTPEVVATLVALVVAWRTRNFLASLLSAMAALWIVQALT